MWQLVQLVLKEIKITYWYEVGGADNIFNDISEVAQAPCPAEVVTYIRGPLGEDVFRAAPPQSCITITSSGRFRSYFSFNK